MVQVWYRSKRRLNCGKQEGEKNGSGCGSHLAKIVSCEKAHSQQRILVCLVKAEVTVVQDGGEPMIDRRLSGMPQALHEAWDVR